VEEVVVLVLDPPTVSTEALKPVPLVLLLDLVKTVVLPDPVTEVLGPLPCAVILPSKFELIIVVPALPPLLTLAIAVTATGVPAVQPLSPI
jgi:hypothetical protein